MRSTNFIFLGLIYLLVMNMVAIAAFVADKKLAQNGRRRISEASLLMLSLLGGTPGSITAQQLIRHKTQKQPFKSRLYSIAVLQVLFLVALCFPDFRAFVSAAISDLLAGE